MDGATTTNLIDRRFLAYEHFFEKVIDNLFSLIPSFKCPEKVEEQPKQPLIAEKPEKTKATDKLEPEKAKETEKEKEKPEKPKEKPKEIEKEKPKETEKEKEKP